MGLTQSTFTKQVQAEMALQAGISYPKRTPDMEVESAIFTYTVEDGLYDWDIIKRAALENVEFFVYTRQSSDIFRVLPIISQATLDMFVHNHPLIELREHNILVMRLYNPLRDPITKRFARIDITTVLREAQRNKYFS